MCLYVCALSPLFCVCMSSLSPISVSVVVVVVVRLSGLQFSVCLLLGNGECINAGCVYV
jgi:hypothetical protein